MKRVYHVLAMFENNVFHGHRSHQVGPYSKSYKIQLLKNKHYKIIQCSNTSAIQLPDKKNNLTA